VQTNNNSGWVLLRLR